MKLLPIIILALVAEAFTAEPVYLEYRQAFGIKASNISGYGAFYGFKPTDDLRLQATGIFYYFDYLRKNDENKRRTFSGYSAGVEIQKDIIQQMKYRFYLMTGGYYYRNDDSKPVDANRLHVITNSYNCGIGIGYEYFFHRVSLGLELGYKFFYDKSRESVNNGQWVPVLEKVSKIGAGLNFGFIFQKKKR